MWTRWQMHGVGLAAIVVALVGVSSAQAADRKWTEAKGPNFTVISDNGSKTAQRVAWELEQMRAGLQKTLPWSAITFDRPYVVLATQDEQGMKALVPAFWESGSNFILASSVAKGADRDWAALRSDLLADDKQGRVNPYKYLYSAYAARVISEQLGNGMPMWVFRGLRELMSNTLVRQSEVIVGMVERNTLDIVRGGERPRLRDLATADRTSTWLAHEERERVFDAASGIFVHYLMFGQEGALRPKFAQLLQLLAEDVPPMEAFRKTLGEPDALEDAFRLYLNGRVFNYAGSPSDIRIPRDTIPTRELTGAQAAAERARWHVAMGRAKEARALLAEAMALQAALPAIAEVEGTLYDTERNSAAARTAYARAIEQGSTNFFVHYRWASLTWSGPSLDSAAGAQVIKALTQANALAPQYATAFVLLADVHSRLGSNDEAVTAAVTAVRLRPTRSEPRQVLAAALWRAGQKERAREEAQRAVRLAESASERQEALELLPALERESPRQ